MITREDIADLRAGDVVEIRNPSYTDVVTRGPLRQGRDGALWLAAYVVRFQDGEPGMPEWPLTVISRAPRPLYVNSDRETPHLGDVARDDKSDNPGRVWVYGSDTRKKFWSWAEYPGEDAGPLATVSLRLLVDGRTGRTVQ